MSIPNIMTPATLRPRVSFSAVSLVIGLCACGSTALDPITAGPSTDAGVIEESSPPEAAVDFTLPSTLSITRGSSVSLVVQWSGPTGAPSALAVTVEGLPAGVTASPAAFSLGGLKAVVTLSASDSAAEGPKTISIAVGGSTSKPLSLLVRGRPGTLDETFGTAGLSQELPDLIGVSLAVDTASRYVIAGWTAAPYLPPSLPLAEDQWAVARLESKGAIDQTFGGGGTQVGKADGASADRLSKVTVLPDGNVLAIGEAKVKRDGCERNGVHSVLLTAQGAPVGATASDATRLLEIMTYNASNCPAGAGMALDSTTPSFSDGALGAVVRGGNSLYSVRVLADGRLELAHEPKAGGFRFLHTLSDGTSLPATAIDADGSVWVFGRSGLPATSNELGIFRYDASGKPDIRFAYAGQIGLQRYVGGAGIGDVVHSVFLGSRRRLLTTAKGVTGPRGFGVGDAPSFPGAPDLLPFSAADSGGTKGLEPQSIATRPDGTPLVLSRLRASESASGPGDSPVLMALGANGKVDPVFPAALDVPAPLASTASGWYRPVELLITPDGKAVALLTHLTTNGAGSLRRGTAVARYWL
jgi:hypothetical protein